MKEKIYTIPVNEAFDETCDCPICRMVKKLEESRVKYMLGPAMMEPDIRIETNSTGFCKRHYEQMFAQENKLSLALILQTHLDEINKQLATQADAIQSAEPQKKSLFKKDGSIVRFNAKRLATTARNYANQCVICNHIQATLERYIDTLFYMWHSESAFKEKFANASHFCMEHYALLAESAGKYLKEDELKPFLIQLNQIQQKHLKTLKSDVDRFILKFDYRNKDMPWENAKDAPKRTLQTLSGAEIE